MRMKFIFCRGWNTTGWNKAEPFSSCCRGKRPWAFTCFSHHHSMAQQHEGWAGGELAIATNFVLFSWLSSLHVVLDVQFSRALICSSFLHPVFSSLRSGSNMKLVLETPIQWLAHVKAYASHFFHPKTTIYRSVINFSISTAPKGAHESQSLISKSNREILQCIQPNIQFKITPCS